MYLRSAFSLGVELGSDLESYFLFAIDHNSLPNANYSTPDYLKCIMEGFFNHASLLVQRLANIAPCMLVLGEKKCYVHVQYFTGI